MPPRSEVVLVDHLVLDILDQVVVHRPRAIGQVEDVVERDHQVRVQRQGVLQVVVLEVDRGLDLLQKVELLLDIGPVDMFSA